MEIDGFTQFLGLVNLLGAVHGVFLALVIAIGRGRPNAALMVLAAFILSFSLVIGGTTLGALQLYKNLPHLIRIGDPITWLLGPLLYLYVKTLREGHFRTVWLIHLIPFISYTIWMIPDFFLLSGTEKIRFVEETMMQPDARYWLVALARLPFNAAYIIALLMLLKRHRAEVEQSLSWLKPASLDWARWLVTTLMIVIAVAMLFYLMAWSGWIFFLQANYLIAFVMSVIVYTIGYRGMTQKVLDKEMHIVMDLKKESSAAKEKVSTHAGSEEVSKTGALGNISTAGLGLGFGLRLDAGSETETGSLESKGTGRGTGSREGISSGTGSGTGTMESTGADSGPGSRTIPGAGIDPEPADNRIPEVYTRVKDVMETEQIWTKADLNIQELADAAGQPRYLVSRAINEQSGMNFHDFVNSYRVRAVKKRLTDPSLSHYTILAIAMDCGFNTKSSFNAAFLKHTGQTPSSWKKSIPETASARK